ncbi:MAG: DUF58 domain-containing protein, partial [Flavobacterium sp.]
MKKLFRSLYLNNLFFYGLLGLVALYVLSFLFHWLFQATNYLLLMWLVLLGLDMLILFRTKTGIQASRVVAEKLSNGDQNPVDITLENYYTFNVRIKIIDEIPFQFQVRNFELSKTIKANTSETLRYHVRPVERGEYHFGKLNVYVASPLGLVSRRFVQAEGV